MRAYTMMHMQEIAAERKVHAAQARSKIRSREMRAAAGGVGRQPPHAHFDRDCTAGRISYHAHWLLSHRGGGSEAGRISLLALMASLHTPPITPRSLRLRCKDVDDFIGASPPTYRQSLF